MTGSRNFIIRAIALISVIALLPIFSSCNGNDTKKTEQSSEYHTITFNTNGGSLISAMEVKHGKMASAPKDPTLENYIFCRWQTTGGRAFFFEHYAVKEDLDLEAVWIKATDLFSLAPMPDSDGVMITKIKRQEEFNSLVVPSVINGKTVEGIGAEAFSGIVESHAKKIVFPNTVRYVEMSAFESISLVELVFNGPVSYLEESSFEYCATLTSLKLGTGLTEIPFRAFSNCSSLKATDIPEGITSIKENAFGGCSSLRTVVLPSSLTTVENGAFDDCTSIKSVFFKGSEEEFDAIDFTNGNKELTDATVYFYSEEQPTEEGVYWHYDKNNSPTIW